MSTLNPSNPPRKPTSPWYKEPYLWLVLGGPLAVVVASFVTYGVAMKYQDPVLSRQPAVAAEDADGGKPGSGADRAQALARLPAQQARNHVMTPNLPKN